MPLVKPILEKGFRDIIESPPKNPIEAANKMAGVYADYAASALALPAGPPNFTGTEKRVMANILVGGFNPMGSPPAAVGAILSGVVAFWTSPPVIFGPGVPPAIGPSTLVLPLGSAALQICLVSSFGNPNISSGRAAALLANCFDAFTKLVQVTFPIVAPPGFAVTFVA